MSTKPRWSRRRFVGAAAGVATAGLGLARAEDLKIELPPIQAPTEPKEKSPETARPPAERVGFALVGLGRLTLNELMPAFGRTRRCRPVALVSGDPEKARKLARQHGIREDAIYDYAGFDRIAGNPEVRAVYVVLPNSMHAEYTIRAAKAGKHVLCEKPMATSVADGERMIAACRDAKRHLMIAYRQQYEPMNRAIVDMVRQKALGELRDYVAVNSHAAGDPGQWRLKKALAGGGPLPDLGVYCINGARFLSGEEPVEVVGHLREAKHDPRFREVEEAVQFVMRFPSGFTATATTSYAVHRSQWFRLQGTTGWLEMSPAYAYRGLKLRHAHTEEGRGRVEDLQVAEVDQFAREMDHFAHCVETGQAPHSPGEDGLQDLRIIEAIYASARSGRPVPLQPRAVQRGAIEEI
jgi:predicted dehydrogenase